MGPILTIWVISLLVLVFERDLGTSLIFFGLFVVMLYMATERASWVICGLVMAACRRRGVGHDRTSRQRARDGMAAPHGHLPARGTTTTGLISDQSAQALFSFGSGGISGTGLGHGHPELVGFAGNSDFILTTVGEELGLTGVIAVLMVYLLFAER
ncbi:FtsW/RodA/SpoVE family cell cycle protein [Streptomyces sp. NPDC055709]